MELSLRKDEALPLPVQISGLLRKRILSGTYAPGKRLCSVRQFAEDFAVSPVTVIKALDILESEALIQRIPMKGIYVSEGLKKERRRLNVCFAFPEKELSPELLPKENWALSSELHRGLLSAAAKNNTALQFVYFTDFPDPELLKIQTAELKHYDFVIFVGHQLKQLQRAIAGQLPAFRMIGKMNEHYPEGMVPVDYDRALVFRRMAEHIRTCGCRQAGILSQSNESGEKNAEFRRACEECGISVEKRFIWEFHANTIREELNRRLAGPCPDFFYCAHTESVPLVYEAAFQNGIQIGKDIQLAGIATGMTFSGLLPRFTYFRIPRFEMGCRIMNAGADAVRSGGKCPPLPLFHAEFVQGESTSPLSTKEK